MKNNMINTTFKTDIGGNVYPQNMNRNPYILFKNILECDF